MLMTLNASNYIVANTNILARLLHHRMFQVGLDETLYTSREGDRRLSQ
jgi:hypothetical protein